MVASTTDLLAQLLSQNGALYAAYENFSNGQTMLLAGTIDDPNSFDVNGGKTGALGYYPVVNVSGQTIYAPCMARLRAIAAEVPELHTVTANTLAIPGDKILADTTAASFTITLPAGGGSVTINDAHGTWGTHPVTVNGNGRTIDGLASADVSLAGYGVTFTSFGGIWRYALTYLYGA
jgi:hypothetical protein